MPATIARLAQLRRAGPQLLDGDSWHVPRDGLQDRIGQGDLHQLSGFPFEIVELLTVGVLRPGLLQMEIHIDGGPGPVRRRRHDVDGRAQGRGNRARQESRSRQALRRRIRSSIVGGANTQAKPWPSSASGGAPLLAGSAHFKIPPASRRRRLQRRSGASNLAK